MKKLSKKIIVAMLGVLCCVCCIFGGVAAFSQETAVSVAAETTNAPTVSYSGVSTFYNVAGRCDTLITFSENLDGASGTAETTNYAATSNATSLGVKLNGRTFYELYQENSSFHIYYGYGGKFFCFIVPDSYLVATAEYPEPVLTIDVGTPFVAQYLPATTLYYCNGYWLEAAPVKTATVSYSGIHATFNNYTGNGVGRYDTIIEFSANLGSAADQTNLAETLNRTSLGVKLNGKTFYELYKENRQFYIYYGYGGAWFVFIIPDSYFVAAEGASEPVLTIDEGTPFMGSYLPAVELHGNLTTKTWYKYEKINDTPDFVSSRSSNPSDGWPFYGVYLKYNTADFIDVQDQAIVSGSTGFTFNGTASDITNIVFWGNAAGENDELLFWLSSDKCVADYNGYSHPTLEIAEGATVTNAAGQTFTLKALTLYLVDGAWTTTKPDGYAKDDSASIPALGTPNCDFTSFGPWNNEGGKTLFYFRDFVNKPTATVSYLQATGHYIHLNGERLTEINGVNVYTWENTCWLRIDIPNPAEGDILTIEEGTPFAGNYLPKLAFKFVGGVWCKAFEINIAVGEETFVVYSQDDVPVIIDDAYFETLLAQCSIPAKAVSFSTRGVTYSAGATLKVARETDLTVEAIGFNTENGASVRLATPTGMRFETHIDKADYDRFVETYGAENVEVGTYILPKTFLKDTDFRSYFADSTKVDGTDYVKIVNSGFANMATAATDGYYQYYGSLVEIRPVNYCTEFFGIGYIEITDGDDVYTVFGGYSSEKHTRSVYYVASSAYTDYESDSAQKNVLKSYLDGVVYITEDVQISNVIDIDGYVSPYSVTYDSKTGVYTITGAAEIKSVMIGDKKRVVSRTSALEVNGEEYYITDYSLTASAASSTLTFKISPVLDPLTLVDFTLEIPSNGEVKILQLTDTELMDAAQARASANLTVAQKEEYARTNIYANCFNYISELVAQERPNLIILTGDIVNGSFDDNGSMWLRLIEFMDSLDIPWAPIFGALEKESAKGATWQRAQLVSAQNCLFKAGSASGNGDYTIGITDNGVIRRVIYMLDSNAGDGINQAQIDWVKEIAENIEAAYGAVSGFVCYNKSTQTDFSSDFVTANIDGVFMGNSPDDNSTLQTNGVYYTYGTKTGSYGEHNDGKLGGTYIYVAADGKKFTISAVCLDKTMMKNKESLHLVEKYDGSSLVTDAYLAPIWDTDRIYDETGLFVGETGSVTLMYTPTDPKEVTIRDITLGTIYTYGVDYTISGNKVTRVAGGHLPYMTYEEYYRLEAVNKDGQSIGFPVKTENGKAEDGYAIDGTRYLFFSEGFGGFERYVTFTYNKTEAWTGTTITGDTNAQSFIDKLKTDKEATIFFYGDSITVGCNASGTEWGDYRNPNLPAWNDLVTNSLEELYGANITKYNGAVGGWTTAQGAENLSAKIAENGTSFAAIDLFVIGFGMNDPSTSEATYIASIKEMINAYYAANPDGSVLLVSPMLPNTQSSLILGNQTLWENSLNTIKNSAEYSGKNISLAKVHTMFSELVSVSKKLARDYLGNNVNHPNDFGVRIYAQVILKTLCGDDFA